MNSEDRTYFLLQIVEKCAGHAGKLGNIQSWAMDELLKMNGELKDVAAEKVKAEQQVAASKVAADRQADNKDHKVDLNFGAPRAAPFDKPEPEVNGEGDTPNLVDRRV